MTRHKRISVILLMLSALPATLLASGIVMEPLASYPPSPDPAVFGQGAAESVAYDAQSRVLIVSNRAANAVDVIDVSAPEAPWLVASLDLSPFGKEPTSVDIGNGLGAVTVVNNVKTDNGVTLLFEIDDVLLGSFDPIAVTVGALPDGMKFTPDSRTLVVVNEGEPNDEYTVDPEGSISIIDIASLSVRTAGFAGFNRYRRLFQLQGIRIFGPGATVAQDLEPENLTISDDSATAWVTLQENNALAIVDLSTARVKSVVPLGYKLHLAPANSLDASDKDDAISLRTWPLFGMYQPDGIAAFKVRNRTYVITANEGDARDYAGFSEEARVKDLTLTSVYEQHWPGIQESENLGRLKTTTAPPAGKIVGEDGSETYSRIYAYGARSFSIWNDRGIQVYDSQNDLEEIVANTVPQYFNVSNDSSDFDTRSDDKGPEPEGVTVGQIEGVPYAFVSIERVGGIMAFDLSNPRAPLFVDYANNRDFEGDPTAGTAGDLGPEGMAFISADESPIGIPLLAVAHELSGTTTLYRITVWP